MPVYKITLHGVEAPLLVRAESAAQAKDQILDLKALTSDEMADAMESGTPLYKEGDSVLGTRTLAPEEKKPDAKPEPQKAGGGEPGADEDKK